jgi:DNA repair protein RadA/Sms
LKNKALSVESVVIGEVGLTGEVRAVSRIESRIMEASRIGMKRCVIPAGNSKVLKQSGKFSGIEIITVDTVRNAIDLLL